MAERTDSGRLFQRDGAHKWKALAPVLVLTLGTDTLLSLFDLSERNGSIIYFLMELWTKQWSKWTNLDLLS